MSTKQKDFYVSIDSLLDTRFGVVERMKEGHGRKLISEGKWHRRKSDFFPEIDREEFLKIYQAYEMETLEHSIITNASYVLFDHIKDFMLEHIAMEIHPDNRPKLHVNVYPYDFPEEAYEELRALVFLEFKRVVDVIIINTPVSELTPTMCRERYFMMFMYDYIDWINSHGDELEKILQTTPRIDDLIIAGPILFFNTDPEKDETTREYLAKGINPLALFDGGPGMRIGVRLIDPDVFCVKYPDDRILRIQEMEEENKPLTLEEYTELLKRQSPTQD